MHSSAEKTVRLGRGQLEVSFPKSTTVIEPRFIQGLPEEKSAIVRALRHPIQSPPLAEWIKPERLLNYSSSFEDVFKFILDPGREEPEQWQVIVQMVIQRKAEVMVYSRLPDEKVLGAKMLPCSDIAAAVRERMLGPDTRVAVLPQGPLTVPYIR
jgi:hypothetical protein